MAILSGWGKVPDTKARLNRSQSGLERTSLLFLSILEGILFGPVAFLSWSSFIADSISFTVAGERNIVFSFGSLRVFLKEKDVEIILTSIFAAIVLKNELNSEAILRLFVSILLLMCKLLGCCFVVVFV